MKYLLVVLLLVGYTLPGHAAEATVKKKAPVKTEAKEETPSAEAVAIAKTLTPSQKSKLLELINKGDDAALQSLPGIGPAKAKGIVKARPFATPAELVKVTGIGEETLADIVAHAKAGFPGDEKGKPATGKKKATQKKSEAADKKAVTE